MENIIAYDLLKVACRWAGDEKLGPGDHERFDLLLRYRRCLKGDVQRNLPVLNVSSGIANNRAHTHTNLYKHINYKCMYIYIYIYVYDMDMYIYIYR